MTTTENTRPAEAWPAEYEEPCRHCGDPITYTRKGTGEPWKGSRDYWYTFAHSCAAFDAARAAMATVGAAVAGALR